MSLQKKKSSFVNFEENDKKDERPNEENNIEEDDEDNECGLQIDEPEEEDGEV